MSIIRFTGAAALGAALMYFFDPVRGRKRRARFAELVQHAQHVERALVGKAARDARHRVRGFSGKMRHALESDVTDGVLQSRARAVLGRVVSHPGAIECEIAGGRAVLRGPILATEAPEAIARVARIPGIDGVVDRLERHGGADVPALQGGRAIRAARHAWPPALQVGAIGGGLAAALYGLVLRRGLVGTAVGAAGGVLAVRGLVNRPLRQLVEPSGEVVVQKTITVAAPVHMVFDLWTRPDQFPRFMEHVRDVEIIGSHSKWRIDGPAGQSLEFVSRVTRLVPDRVIAWHTMPHQPIEHQGTVRFDEVAGGTRVHLTMRYHPPGGLVGHAVAHLLGWDPKRRLDDDLVRMKALLEDGHTRAHGHRVSIGDVS